jgi:uncharacterized cupredoxin-like copper-binding protein
MKRILAAATAVLLLAACGAAQTATPKSAASGATTVSATLTDDFKITIDKATVPAGKVTFDVKNAGKVTHEVVLLKTDLRYDQLPVDPAAPGKILEDEGQTIVHIGETDDMDPGTTKTFSADLTPGKYVLTCNQLGHYAGGMRIPFTVQ